MCPWGPLEGWNCVRDRDNQMQVTLNLAKFDQNTKKVSVFLAKIFWVPFPLLYMYKSGHKLLYSVSWALWRIPHQQLHNLIRTFEFTNHVLLQIFAQVRPAMVPRLLPPVRQPRCHQKKKYIQTTKMWKKTIMTGTAQNTSKKSGCTRRVPAVGPDQTWERSCVLIVLPNKPPKTVCSLLDHFCTKIQYTCETARNCSKDTWCFGLIWRCETSKICVENCVTPRHSSCCHAVLSIASLSFLSASDCNRFS